MPELKTASFRETPGVSKVHQTKVSSAIFYYPDDRHVDMTISFLNYWKIKRQIDVDLVATTRRMGGEVVLREEISFDGHDVINYRPNVEESAGCSVELVASSDDNLVIPYTAMVGVYETARGISAVHSYGRAYSDLEIESGEVHTTGNEGSWTIRDSDKIRSFSVFHNGHRTQPAQTVKLTIINERGERRSANIACPAMEPFGSFRICPQDHIGDLVDFLDAGVGVAAVLFSVQNSFPRMLIGNEAIDGGDMQVTHSNFNFSSQPTDYMDDLDDSVCKYYPGRLGEGREMLIYPTIVPGRYTARHGDKEFAVQDGTITRIPMSQSPRMIDFSRDEGEMPTRMPLGLVVQDNDGVLPSECAFSAMTDLEPPKRFHWGICAADKKRRTRLVVMDLEKIHGGMPADLTISISLYGSVGQPIQKATLTKEDLAGLHDGVYLDQLFPDVAALMGGDFGCYVVFCEYGGLICYSIMEKSSTGSVALEHSF
jgi:hypothetical protein